MRSPHWLLLAPLLLAGLSACSSTTIDTDWDKQLDFSRYQTFAWFDDSKATNPPHRPNQIVDIRIRRAIAETLLASGLEQTAPDKSDFWVTYYTNTERQWQMVTTGWGYGYWGGWGYGHTSMTHYDTGTLVIDVIDRNRGELVWRSILSKALSSKDTTDNRINQAVNEMLKDFPPKS